MLAQLKQDFEIILFSAKNSVKYVEKVMEAIELDNDKYFDHIICAEDMFYFQDIDFYILDLNVLMGQAPLTNSLLNNPYSADLKSNSGKNNDNNKSLHSP